MAWPLLEWGALTLGALGVEKEYGKLTAEEFARLVGKLPELRQGEVEVRRQASRLPKRRIRELLGEGSNWAPVYEMPMSHHLALVFLALDGGYEYLRSLAELPDPQRQILDDLDTGTLEIDPDTWQGGHLGVFSKQDLLGLCYSLQRTVLSIMLFQRSISALVEEVRETEDPTALFNAVRVDRTVVTCPTVADRIARAQFADDKTFFLHLRSALKGPQQKHWEHYKDLRYSLAVLRELGFDKLSDAQLEDLLVHKLRVYPSVPGARKNLRRQYQLSKKIPTI